METIVPIMSLWMPILLSAVIVFIASAILHMILPFHRKDVLPLPEQDQVGDALRKFTIPPGDYMFPHGGGPEAMKDPAFIEKYKRGPVGTITIFRSGNAPSMGKELFQWFLYCVLVSLFAAYVAGRAVGPGADYLEVHRFAGVTAFCAYALALLQNSIWWKKNWGATLRSMVDGLIYAGLTGGVFGWLWPSM